MYNNLCTIIWPFHVQYYWRLAKLANEVLPCMYVKCKTMHFGLPYNNRVFFSSLLSLFSAVFSSMRRVTCIKDTAAKWKHFVKVLLQRAPVVKKNKRRRKRVDGETKVIKWFWHNLDQYCLRWWWQRAPMPHQVLIRSSFNMQSKSLARPT